MISSPPAARSISSGNRAFASATLTIALVARRDRMRSSLTILVLPIVSSHDHDGQLHDLRLAARRRRRAPATGAPIRGARREPSSGGRGAPDGAVAPPGTHALESTRAVPPHPWRRAMATKVGINGFGRIGRLAFRAIRARYPEALEVVAVNDLFDAETNAHLLKYDSTYGAYSGTVEARAGQLVIDGKAVAVSAERDPGAIRWKEHGVDVVIESTGLFTDATKARAHITSGGARKVIISAPAKNEDITIVLGVNDDKCDPAAHHVVSNASCTTNGLAPVAKVLNDRFGIDRGLLTTVHAYTNSQKLQDVGAKDLRDARAAAQNIVPSPTGAAKAVGLVIPELVGKFSGMAFRVPTPTVSVVDFTAVLNKEASKEEIRDAMLEYAQGPMKGILDVTDEPPVSTDLRGTNYSSVYSAMDTLVIGNMVKVVAWYDNEWGYACRTADLTAMVAKSL